MSSSVETHEAPKESKLERAMNKMKKILSDQGLEPSDLPMAFVSHEVIALGIAAGAWGLCYAVQPSKTVASTLFSNNDKVKLAMQKAEEQVGKIKWLSKVPGNDPVRTATSLAESIVFRMFAKPITFTFKIWACVEFTKAVKKLQGKPAPTAKAIAAQSSGGGQKSSKATDRFARIAAVHLVNAALTSGHAFGEGPLI